MAVRIPPTQMRRIAPEVSAAPRVADASVDSSGLARGLSSLAGAVDRVYQQEVREAEQTFAISTDAAATNWKNERFYNPETGAMNQKGGSALGLTERVMGDWNSYAQSVIDSAKTPQQRLIATRLMSNHGSQIQSQLSPYESQQIKVYKDGESAGGIAAAQNDAALNFGDPGVIDQSRLKIEGILDLQGERNGWSPELRDANKQKAISGMYSDVLRRRAATDPYKAQAELKQYQQYLTADDLTQIGSSIDAKVERLQQKAEMQQLRRDTKAAQVLNRVDAQGASGLPATDEMWDKWGADVRGTALWPEFVERRRGAVEAQRVMGLPDDQQQAYLNKRMADLQEKGGTVQELNALNQMQRTLAGGQKLRAEAPIQFAQQREGLSAEVYDPSADNAADVMADRLSTLQSMRQKYGQTVGIKPLLPQEAAGLAAALNKATPGQQVELLGRLHDTIGDRQAYMGALQQIRPGSPVTAVVGAIAGRQKELVAATHWFKPNDVVTSGDIASIIAHGESRINATKQSKEEGGKQKFDMPSDEDFDLAMDNYVGQAYAGRDQARSLDKSVIRAAYAGLSAEYNGGSKTLVPDLLDKAIKYAVGEVTDFNGEDTFVPWGMDADDFKLKARSQLVKAVEESKIGPVGIVNSLTLKPLGDNQYLVYRGGRKQPANPDGTGNLVITIGDDQ